MKKSLKPGDRIKDDDGQIGTVQEYKYPHFHPDGYVFYILNDGREVRGNACGLKKIKT
jgi:hypothetical protein